MKKGDDSDGIGYLEIHVTALELIMLLYSDYKY